ncbi:zinc transporter ZIP9-like isoform X2 [Styela clava]|uniref:zinc transporter ZIP9-like isoform X2 n=1 Tax=Styela clava TaxID=7725 RepID=UPI00193A3094|nr:zinc transporter ZIP9-like isoform X2 [Styela clava]
MISEFFSVVALSAFMFVGCLVSGYIPLSFSLSQRKIQLFTIFGAGLLVGTALAVIIPEGVETIYNSHEHDSSEILEEKRSIVDEDVSPSDFKSAVVEGEKHEHEEHHANNHKVVGISLLLGFVSMLLVDQLSGSHGHSHPPDIKLDNLTQSVVGTARQPQSSNKGMTATIGLVVHAAADGIALGAAATTSRSDLQVIVFLAIMLHKAPAAFGLVSFLMHDGLEPRKIKRHLLVFSSAAPALAIFTFFVLHQYSGTTLHSVNGTGIAMLFSAGTFLYVATVHVLPEVSHQASSGSHSSGLSRFEVTLLVLGCLLPLILNIGHHH